MPNVYNRTAFRTVASNAATPVLLRAYLGLVLVELALKDRLAGPNLQHDVPTMLQRLAQVNRPQSAALTKHRSTLTDKLQALMTMRIDGSIGRVRPTAYPDLRYLRHDTDWNSDACTDQQLDDLRKCVDQIRAFLKTNVGFSQPI